MKKGLILIMILSMILFATPIYGEDEVMPPTKPQLEEPITNESISEYNKEVDKYNEQVDKEYEEKLNTYNQELEEVQAHNQIEQEKVDQNQKELEEQQELEEKIEQFEEKSLDNSTTNIEEAPTDFEGESLEPRTITIQPSENSEKIEETYKVANVHVFLKEKEDYSFFDNGPNNIQDESFQIDDEILADAILIEWETVTAKISDIVSVRSESLAMGYSSAAFYRYMEGYTNGFWIPVHSQIYSLAKRNNWDYDTELDQPKYFEYEDSEKWQTWGRGGEIKTFSYDEGTTTGEEIKNIYALWTYSFIRYGAEPVKILEYVSNFRDEPEKPVKGEYLDKLELLPQEENKIKEEGNEAKEKENNIIQKIETQIEKENNVVITTEPVETVENPQIITPAPTTIEDTIVDEPAPKTMTAGYWALINLICTIITLLISLILILFGIKNKLVDENDEIQIKNKNFFRILSIIIAVISIIIFILTENIFLPMVLIDRWTWLMVIILLIQIIIMILSKHKEKEKEEDE